MDRTFPLNGLQTLSARVPHTLHFSAGRYHRANTIKIAISDSIHFLEDTSSQQKNAYFAQFIPSFEVLQATASASSLVVCPDLLEIFQAATPPSVDFKKLPTDVESRWGIYAFVLEKPGSRSAIYIGSGTNAIGGVKHRFFNYDNGYSLGKRVESTLNDGWSIAHKGLLCWGSIPTADLVPLLRVLYIALETVFAYVFWTMTKTKGKGKRNMAHISLWELGTHTYDGLCSHPALLEGILGGFDLTPE
ncbi:uncharacterized protein A1O9_03887 [Exophiala aquamarina CBS 119918]|uniref:Uncharacterized protein n=1 Tax=Exophiala aquamarina CBS 119918 TaxID=1182545 RepID=A0A072PFY4_9EURO|nr:uncharacterized protein A1O9_03887 [Exophiala aquamarina CBS 119918]KEF59044.1 hypothetical protein A1O9_03887 [Exophiala aquamarina CBS 119918]